MRNLLENFHTIVFDFDGVITDNFVYIDENSIESVRVSRADGYAIDLLRKFQKKNLKDCEIFANLAIVRDIDFCQDYVMTFTLN